MADDQRPRTVASVRERHLGLMREWRGLADDRARCEAATAFRREVQAAGADIADTGPGTGERDEAQGIIDYWASAVAGLPGVSYPELLTLAPYSGAAARQAGQTAAQAFAALDSEEERRAARQLFQYLLSQGADGVERARPQTRDLLARRIRSAALDGVLARFEGTGAITRLPGEVPADDRFEVSDLHVIDQWPELSRWLAEQYAYYTEREAVVAQAERWQASGEDRDLLATGRRVDLLQRYTGQTELVDRFVEASQAAKRRRASLRNTLSVAAVLAGVVAVALIAFLYAQWAGLELRVKEDRAIEETAVADARLAGAVAVRPRAEGAEPEAGNLLPRVSPRVAPASLPGLSGALWLGSATRSQVRPADPGGARIAPDRAVPGTRYRVPAAITLRAAKPDPDGAYVSKGRVALVPAGSLVVVEGGLQPYDRPSGTQYWADVRVVPRVFIQYTGGDRAAAERLRGQVRDAGFDVPPAELIGSAKGRREVRWSHGDDRPAAALLARSLADGGPVACRSLERARQRNAPFILELWVDFAAPGTVGCR